MAATSLITGIGGQDGSYLAEHLLERGDHVVGIVRRNSVPEHQSSRIDHIRHNIELCYADLTDPFSILNVVQGHRPTHIFHLASQSHVRVSFDVAASTAQINAIGTLNILEAVRRGVRLLGDPPPRFYFAASSEMFGNSFDTDGFQRLSTPMNPTSPYGIAKLYGYHMTRHYRRAHRMFATNGILFNHTSPRRGSNFVIAKIVKAAVQIKLGQADKLVLGNMDAKRDFGHSKDYTRAMILMLDQPAASDWLIATGETRSIREICQFVFDRLSMDYRHFVTQDDKYKRPEELSMLRGDSTSSRQVLGWQPEYTFESMLDEIIEHWQEVLG